MREPAQHIDLNNKQSRENRSCSLVFALSRAQLPADRLVPAGSPGDAEGAEAAQLVGNATPQIIDLRVSH